MKFLEFSDSDYQIHDRKHLDKYLVELASLVVENQQTDPDRYGMVGACVLDPDHNAARSTTTKEGDKWKHAEANAIESYIKTHGDIPEGSIIITTLSPCNSDMDDRYGESCTDLINASLVKKVYCGYMDPSQHDDHAKFTQEETTNQDIKKFCKKLAWTFLGGPDHPVDECGGTGVIASKSQAKDPRYSMSLTKDVRPGQVEKNLKAFSLAQENFADGKGPGKPGDSQRHGIPKGASMSELEKASHSKGRKGQLARWQLNMRRGHKK